MRRIVLALAASAAGFPVAALESSELYKKISRSVVVIFVPGSLGSGVLITNRLIATNCHVVQRASEIEVEFFGARMPGATVGRNDANDVCIVQIKRPFEGAAPVSGVRLVNTIQVGEPAFAIGAPVGLKYSMTSGIVSQLRQHEGGQVIQFDAAISGGNSGGGLFDRDGRLLGLPSFKLTGSSIGNAPQNLNFAWSVDVFPSPADSVIAKLAVKAPTQPPRALAEPPVPTTAAELPPTARSSDFSARWLTAFERKDIREALAIADAWVAKESLNSDALVARGRSREASQGGSGRSDFESAIKLNQSHQSALYFAALSARAANDPVYFQRYKSRLKSLNPRLAASLP